MGTARDSFSRRTFLQFGASAAALGAAPRWSAAAQAAPDPDPYLTPQEKFRDVSRGNPLPHKLPLEKLTQVGLTRETWKLEVVSDPLNKADLKNPLTKEKGTALDWERLMKLAEKRSVSFLKVMTCNNIGRPLGMGLWEGVPLRDVIWLTKPQEDLRRVFYYGYHNDDPKQMFRSSLPIGRVLEDPAGVPPVILCTKLNGKSLTPERGGPVRIVVPEAYGFKSVKWLTHVVLTNLFHANDTYADGNNDVDSAMKTFARFTAAPASAKPDEAVPLNGLVQVGISGLSKVQVWAAPAGDPWPADDPYFTKAPWRDAEILPAPATWGGDLPEGKLPTLPMHFDETSGRPRRWPLPLTKALWTARLPGMPAGKYTLRCRTIDENGQAQPMHRPFDKSGRAGIEEKPLIVK
ncbi:MAG: molybdopterin-dependent oxidoreductase [Planctomycetes bacterium]|nr:molybdopterin-dependent oxidoreductase [Planctomycetota bacterium]